MNPQIFREYDIRGVVGRVTLTLPMWSASVSPSAPMCVKGVASAWR